MLTEDASHGLTVAIGLHICYNTNIIQYGSNCIIRDQEDLGFSAQKYHPKTSLTLPFQWFGSIG